MRVWAFDKPTMRAREARIQEVASRNGFHDLIPGDTKQELEKLFADEIEPEYKKALEQLMTHLAEGRPFDQQLKFNLGYFLALQYLRTQAFRAAYEDVLEQYLERLRLRLKRVQPEQPWDEVRLNTQAGAAPHGLFMLDNTTLLTMASVLAQHVWHVGRNLTGTPFFTSDAPVVWVNANELPPLFGRGGLNTHGVHVLFPLSPRHLLVMTERRYADAHLPGVDSRVLPYGAPLVREANLLQVEQSDRQLFAPVNAFQLIREVRDDLPEAFQANRRRITVG